MVLELGYFLGCRIAERNSNAGVSVCFVHGSNVQRGGGQHGIGPAIQRVSFPLNRVTRGR